MEQITFDTIGRLPSLIEFYNLVRKIFKVDLGLVAPDCLRVNQIKQPHQRYWNPFCGALGSTDVGQEACWKCDHRNYLIASKRLRPIRHLCHMGMRDIIFPIIIDGELIAFLQCGQVLDAPPTEDGWRVVAKRLEKIGLDPEPFKEPYMRTPVVIPANQRYLMEILSMISHELVRAEQQRIRTAEMSMTSITRQTLSFVRSNVDKPVLLDDIAHAAHTSKRNLCRQVKIDTGKTVMELVREKRVSRACELLFREDMNCVQVSNACGFETVRTFNRAFRLEKGCSPRQWLRRERKHAPGDPEFHLDS